jgi:phenylalanyl-tRNA synthetase beta chain
MKCCSRTKLCAHRHFIAHAGNNMKVTYNWLKDFVDIRLPAQELANKLTMAGLEVTGLEKREDDFVFEIEVTSNRPDCLSVVGIAREVAAITRKKLASWPVSQLVSSTGKPANRPTGQPANRPTGQQANRPTILIEYKKDCLLYTARIIQGVKVAPAPDWMRRRLELVGCRSINNVVDITNYVLFATGEPLHAFDLDKMVSQLASLPVSQLASWPVSAEGGSAHGGSQLRIIVRRAKKGEELITIDGEKRILSEEVLVIAAEPDKITGQQANRQTSQPIAIAGIIGGKDTEVDERTKNILLEAAIFNPLVTRRASRVLGVQTESSYRFERGIDPPTVVAASASASALIEECASAQCLSYAIAGEAGIKKCSILLDALSAEKILGVSLGIAKIKNILTRLGFTVKTKNKNKMQVLAPAWRMDVTQQVDLIEELARINGYESIPPSLPQFFGQAAAYKPDLLEQVKGILVGLGLQEVITYSLLDRARLTGLAAERPVEILNPLSQEQEVLRTTLVPGLLTCVSRNLNQQEPYIAIFETAKRFAWAEKKAPQEELMLGLALCGIRPRLMAEGLIKDKASILHLKGIVETLFTRLGIVDYTLQTGADKAVAVKVQGVDVGTIFEVGREKLEQWDIKNKEVLVAELALEKIFTRAKLEKKFKSLPLYPAIQRDISLVISQGVLVDDLLAQIRQAAAALLAEVKVADFYQGKQIPQGFKGLTLSCVYRSDERTLTEEEVAPLHTRVCAILQDKFAAKIR